MLPPAATTNWTRPDFDDASWMVGISGFSLGFGAYDEATLLDPVPWLFRCAFQVGDTRAISNLVFRVDYQDGLVVHLNGIEVARSGVRGGGGAVIVDAHDRGKPVLMDLSAHRSRLVPGTNVLAVELRGRTPDVARISFLGELLANFTRGPFVQGSTTSSVQLIWQTLTPMPGALELRPVEGVDTAILVEEPTPSLEHVVSVGQLPPATRFRYRVRAGGGASGAWTLPKEISTLSATGGVSLALIGDSGTGSSAQYAIARLLRKHRPDLVLHAGDVIYPSFTFEAADFRCLSVYAEQMRTTPFFFAMGNHDLYSGPEPYRQTFHLPINPVFGNEDFYSFDHGDLHVAVLLMPYLFQYSPKAADPQQTWLDADLAASGKPWKIILLHHPMMSSGEHRFDDQNGNGIPDMQEVRDYVLDVATRRGVQLVLAGHEHVYEKFVPVKGVHHVISGGGGVGLYRFTQHEPNSAYFESRHHLSLITLTNEVLRLQAVGLDDQVFDELVIHRGPTPSGVHPASWGIPVPPPTGPDNGDSNFAGQSYRAAAEPLFTRPGDHSNLGVVHLVNDGSTLQITFAGTLLGDGTDVVLFIDAGQPSGVESLKGLGNGVVDPAKEGADALDFLENVTFDGFRPSMAIVLGDERADQTDQAFKRSGGSFAGGQGAFQLNRSLTTVPGVQVQQFNRAPEEATPGYEHNASFIQVSIPFASFGPGIGPGTRMKIGALVAGPDADAVHQTRPVDSAVLGNRLDPVPGQPGQVVLQGVEVMTAQGPPSLPLRFQTGLDGTVRISWTEPFGWVGLLESAAQVDGPFRTEPAPRIGIDSESNRTAQVTVTTGQRFFRIRLEQP